MNALAERVQLLESTAPDGAALCAMLDKILASIASDYRRDLARFQSQLATFEARYGMSTDMFLRQFESGALGDDPEWFDWESIAVLAEEAKKKLAQLAGTDV